MFLVPLVLLPSSPALPVPASSRYLLDVIALHGLRPSSIPLGVRLRLVRNTGDLGPPLHTPPSNLIFDNYCIDGVYTWDGSQYRATALRAYPNPNVIPADTGLYIPADTNLVMTGELTVTGELKVLGE